MKELIELNKKLKEAFPKNVKKPRIWKEKELINGQIVDSHVIILRTKGCRWAHISGCSMCGYFKETYDAGYDEIKKQIDFAYEKYDGEQVVKFFTSGSFLDKKEIPEKLQLYALKKFSEARKIIIETRPEFVKNLKDIDIEVELEIAMGLESSNDKVLEYSVNKGFRYKPWLKAAKMVKEFGKKLRIYILIKPPFLTEKEAIKDAIESVKKIKDIADTISFNPVAVHGRTIVEQMWKRGLYRPPWLWSVVEILKESRKIYDGVIRCDVVAAGLRRGAHNCGKCDRSFINAINEFNLKQDEKIFDRLDCKCREEWLDWLEIEEYLTG